MMSFEEFLKDTLAYAHARTRPAEPLSTKAEEVIKAALAEKFGKAVVLPAHAMRVVILKLLTNGSRSGAEVVEWLADHRLSTDPRGDGVVFGILHQLESDDLVSTRVDVASGLQRYELTEIGSGLLKKNEAAVVEAFGLHALFAAT